MAIYGVIPKAKPEGAIELTVGMDYQAAVDAAPTGATFWFTPGVHRLASISPKDGQTFIGAEGAVLNGSQLATSFALSDSAWVLSGQTQQGLRRATDETDGVTTRAHYPEMVFLDDQLLVPVDALSNLRAGTFYFDYDADNIYLFDDPAGHKVEVSTADHAFEGGASNVTVKDLTIEKYSTPIQQAAIQGGEGWVAENNEVRWNFGVGIATGSNGRIVGNLVHDNGELGLGGDGANILVQGNEIAHNGYFSGIDVFWEGGGAKFAASTNLTVKDNYSHDNKGFGLWTDIGVYGAIYEGNLVTRNTGGGINHEISYDGVIRDNVLIGNGFADQGGGSAGNPNWLWGAQIMLQNSQNVEVTGNFVDSTNAGNGIAIVQQDRGSGSRGAHTATNNNIHDNTVVQGSGNGRSGGIADFDESGLLNGGNQWAANTYFVGTDTEFWWGGGETFAQFEAGAGGTDTVYTSSTAPIIDLSKWLGA